LVVPPWSFETEIFPNPMLNLGDRTTQLATTMLTAIEASDVRQYVMETGATDYQVTNLAPDSLREPTRSAVLQIVVKGPNQKAAHDGAGRVIDQARHKLAKMQENAGVGKSPYWANLQVIVPPEETVSAGTRQIRGAAAFGAAVFLAGALLFWTIESIRDRRSRSRDRGGELPGEQDFGLRHEVESPDSTDEHYHVLVQRVGEDHASSIVIPRHHPEHNGSAGPDVPVSRHST